MLNHPSIAAIYGLEKSEDTRALILDLVEEPTLQERIAKGPLPLDEALPVRSPLRHRCGRVATIGAQHARASHQA